MQWIKQQMMQVTGSNISDNCENRILSIQLSLSGLYFSVARGSKVSSLTFLSYYKQMSEAANVANALNSNAQLSEQYSCVNVVLDSVDSVIIPESLFDPDNARNILTIDGVELTKDDRVVVSDSVDGMVAVVKYDATVIDVLTHRFANVCFRTPLLVNATDKKNAIIATINDNLLSLSCKHNGKLLYAESLSYTNGEEVCYFVESVRSKLGLDKKFPIYIGGDSATKYMKLLTRSFQNIHLEVFPASLFEQNCGVSNTLYNTLIKLSCENN